MLSREPNVRKNSVTSLVIPTYNEAENLPRVVKQIFELDIEGLEVVVVDDGSPDGTGKIAEELTEQYASRITVIHREQKMGLGGAYKAGFRQALENGAERIVQMDADLSHPPTEIPAMLAALDHNDVVVASRYTNGGGVDPSWSFGRKQISFWGGVGIRLVLGLKVKDATSGFKAFRATALRKIDVERLTLLGFGFQSEVAYRAQQAGLKVFEHPFVFMDRTAGKSKMSAYIVFEALLRLMMIRVSNFRRSPQLKSKSS